MQMKNRINTMGRQYYMMELANGQTEIRTNSAKIVVDHHIEKLSGAWYNWQIRGQYIQVAFPFLSDDEREFILTGITKEKWDEMFKEEEGDEL